jgi:hypothetical protein
MSIIADDDDATQRTGTHKLKARRVLSSNTENSFKM